MPAHNARGRHPATSAMLQDSDRQREFMVAMERYMRTRRRPYPTAREVLRVARALGYKKASEPLPTGL
jgi:hypothetical protein